MIGMIIATIYGWITGVSETNYVHLASFSAIYCAIAAEYESLKKKSNEKA